MPAVFIEAPPGIRKEAKEKLLSKITAAIDEAYHIGDALIFLREYPAENVAMDGRLQSENPRILDVLKKINAGADASVPPPGTRAEAKEDVSKVRSSQWQSQRS